MNRQPLAPDVGVIAMVPDVWGDMWMPRHHILTRLARYFHVAWMDPPVEWRESFSSTRPKPQATESGVRGAGSKVNGDVPDVPGFHIVRPSRFLPRVYRPRLVADSIDRLRIRQAENRLRSAGARRIVLYLWRPDFAYALDEAAADATCYHVDDEYSFSPVEQPVSSEEASLLRAVDDVIIHSTGLWEKRAHFAARPVLIPNGADYAAYSTPTAEAADLRDIPHPRIGYVGVTKSFLNIPLLLELAERHEEWSFVFVGPARNLAGDEGAFTRLEHRRNVHFLGPRPVPALPSYTQHLDVGIMPYDVDEYTRFIYPMKLHEYLGAGLPVVGSPIRTLTEFSGVVALADTPAEWSAALSSALRPEASAAAAIAARRRVAAEHDWNRLAHRVALVFANQLGPDVLHAVTNAGTLTE